MKKRMIKFLSLSLVVLMIATLFSVNAVAYTSDYVTIDCPENFDEKDYSTEDGFYVDVVYSEWYKAEDGNEYYTGNTVNVCIEACWDDTLEDYYYEDGIEDVEWYLEGGVDSIDKTDYYYDTIGIYDVVVYDAYYTYTGENTEGQRVTTNGLCSEIILVTNKCCVSMYVDVMNEDNLVQRRNQLAEQFLKSITYNTEAIENAEAEEKNFVIGFAAVIIGWFLISTIIAVIIVVVVVKSSKKKKAQQQFTPYNNMNVPPQYYNYNPNMPYGNQNANVQPPVSVPETSINEENNTENLDN